MPPLSKIKLPAQKPARTGPLWRGPEVDGITFSLLSRFLSCRERFRCLVVDGLRPADGFNHRLEYGNMWHVCEEASAKWSKENPYSSWLGDLTVYCQELGRRYPTSREQIEHWASVCRVQFPEYVKYWAEHPDVVDRTPLLQEQTFDVPYRLPSGRTVRLRGKWDSVDLIGKGRQAGVYLQENKTKGDIDPERMRRQLTFDLQTMMYLVALHQFGFDQQDEHDVLAGKPILGVRYNVVRRPLSGGKGSIRQHQPTKSNPAGESTEVFYERLRNDYIADDPGYWFMRWKVDVTPGDVQKFRERCLDPILEQLCDWWEFIRNARCVDEPDKALWQPLEYGVQQKPWAPHWQHPFGVYNPLDEGGASDLDEYLATGSEVGLTRCDNLFPELT